MSVIYFFEETFDVGGIETFMVNVIKYLDRNKYQISLVTIQKNTDYFDKVLEKYNVNVIELIHDKISNPIERYARGKVQFKKFLKEKKPQIIHFHISFGVDFLYVDEAKKNGVTYRITHSHNSKANKLYKCIGHYVFRSIFGKSSTYRLACSKEAGRWLYGSKTKDCKILKNGIIIDDYIYNDDIRKTIRHKYNIENAFVILHVGRFNEQKNHRFLIKLFFEYHQCDSDSFLLLVGDGELKQEIISLAREYNVYNYVKFLGVRKDVNYLLMASDVFVLPSLYEGLPIVGVEAQATGIPCIFADTISKELFINENVSFTSINRVDDWMKKLEAIKKKENLRTTRIKLLEHGFDIQKTAKEIEKIYDTFLRL